MYLHSKEMSHGVYLIHSTEQNVQGKMGICSILKIKHFLFTKNKKPCNYFDSLLITEIQTINNSEIELEGTEVAHLME